MPQYTPPLRDMQFVMHELLNVVDELKALGNEIFRFADDPWREKFFAFIAENPGSTFHHAVMSDGVNIVYCRDQDKGMWFLPGSGMGPLQAAGRKMMSEIIRGQR